MKELVEELPRGDSIWSLEPDIWSIDTTPHLETSLDETLAHDTRVLHIIVDSGAYLSLAFFGVDSLGCTLLDVACAIELGTLAAVPQRIESNTFATRSAGCDLARHYRIATADASESCSLGIAVELDGTLLCALALIDAVRDTLLADICLISRIVHDDGIVGQCIIDPFLQLGLRDHSACWVVRIAEIDDIDTFSRKRRHEVVAGIAWSIDDIVASSHSVAIDIDRIDRIGHAEAVVETKDVANVASVALCTIVDKHLIEFETDTTRLEVTLDDSLLQEVIAVFRTIATEGACRCHLIDSSMQGTDDGRTKWLSDIADTQTDDIGFRIGSLEVGYSMSNL